MFLRLLLYYKKFIETKVVWWKKLAQETTTNDSKLRSSFIKIVLSNELLIPLSFLVFLVNQVTKTFIYIFKKACLSCLANGNHITCSRHRNLQNIRIPILQIFVFVYWSKIFFGPMKMFSCPPSINKNKDLENWNSNILEGPMS